MKYLVETIEQREVELDFDPVSYEDNPREFWTKMFNICKTIPPDFQKWQLTSIEDENGEQVW